MNYYNEFNSKAAAWLKELIKDRLIPDGEVDERSITDVRADDLRGFTQCHFFAGVGGWPIALRLAGIPDDFPCWTGSCPCQPFSNAGKRKGMSDERDLWPVFFGLIKECKPQIVIGEQVSSSEVVGSELEASFIIAVQSGEYAKANKIAKKLAATKGFHYHQLWLDRVYSDLESAGYTGRPEVLGAHSVGANHIRQRLYWGAARLAQDSAGLGCRGRDNADPAGDNRQVQAQGLVHDERISDGNSQRCVGQPVPDEWRPEMSETAGSGLPSFSPWSDFGLVLCRDTDKQGRHRVRRVPSESLFQRVADGVSEDVDGLRYQSICEHPEKGFPLCKKGSVEGHNVLLAGYGNAIVPQCGAAFIEEFLESINEKELI